MQNITPRAGMSIIFDVKRLMPGQQQYENFGFSMIPLFSQLRSEDDGLMEFFVNSGIYQVSKPPMSYFKATDLPRPDPLGPGHPIARDPRP